MPENFGYDKEIFEDDSSTFFVFVFETKHSLLPGLASYTTSPIKNNENSFGKNLEILLEKKC